MARQAKCITCGCTDRRACVGGCSWTWVDRSTGTGECSRCTVRRADRSPEFLALALEIADDSARARIECNCTAVTDDCRPGTVYDVSRIDPSDGDPDDRDFLDQALRYLDLRGLIERVYQHGGINRVVVQASDEYQLASRLRFPGFAKVAKDHVAYLGHAIRHTEDWAVPTRRT